MLDDDSADRIARALRSLDEARERAAAETAELRAKLGALIDLLVLRETLSDGHRKHIDRVGKHAAGPIRSVRLRPYVDKHAIVSQPIDCAARLHLCKARCCSFAVELTAVDVEEGRLRWDLETPYLLRKDEDGQCSYLERATGGCTVYEDRPAMCREYDCRHDKRVWIDFEARIPAPMPVRAGDLEP
jgi:hypothetical protein